MNVGIGRTCLSAWLVAAVLVTGCGRSMPESESHQMVAELPSTPNILLIIGDDIGVEALASFGTGLNPAATPNLDALANEGTSFTNVWSQPTCSPSRATIITGRYGFRTGLGFPSGGDGVIGPLPRPPEPPAGSPIEVSEDLAKSLPLFRPWSMEKIGERREVTVADRRREGLAPSEFGLPTAVKNARPEYSTAAIGKWHLGSIQNGWLKHPESLGFDYYSVIPGHRVPSYFGWNENTNGEAIARVGYTPEAKVDDALSWIAVQENNPWFLWFAFNLPHTPFFVPEGADAIGESDRSAKNTSELSESRQSFDLMVTEMDRMIGNLLAGLPDDTRENTIVIFVGDNGSPQEGIDLPYSPEVSKGTLYQGGINVPLIISGPGITGGASISELVNTTDLFATILELTGGQASAEDSISLVPYLTSASVDPLREWVYADRFFPYLGIENGDYAIRDKRFKLVASTDRQELYDLQLDPFEKTNLLTSEMRVEARAALDSLLKQAVELHASAGKVTPGQRN